MQALWAMIFRNKIRERVRLFILDDVKRGKKIERNAFWFIRKQLNIITVWLVD